MKILWILLFAQISSFASTTAQDEKRSNKCCDNEINLIVKNTCAPDLSGKSLQIALKCQAKYILEPSLYDEDNYNVTSNGSLHVFDFESVIPPDE